MGYSGDYTLQALWLTGSEAAKVWGIVETTGPVVDWL